MIIKLKNKDTLIVDDFRFRCAIGKNKVKKNKIEGDLSTPSGIFKLQTLYFRKDRVKKPLTKIKIKQIKNNLGWCNDSRSIFYNKEIFIKKNIKHEKLYRKDNKYDYFIVIDYNTKKPRPYCGSAIFIHLTKDYKPTAGCISLKKKDFEIMVKIIKKTTLIQIN
tara:strand:+ start:51 stop:542 length:492 start_codon:yes stop_codon:yes gene_type:complete